MVATAGHLDRRLWAAVTAEFPTRVSHIVFSNTFYGLVDEDDVPCRARGASACAGRRVGLEHGPGRDDLALMVKEVLGPPDNARLSRSEPGKEPLPTAPDNFTERSVRAAGRMLARPDGRRHRRPRPWA